MKNFLLMVVFLFAAQIILTAQTNSTVFKQRSWELGFTGSLGSMESSIEYSSVYSSSTHSESQKFLQLGLIPAYYLIEGLAVEPEINILTIEKIQPAFLLIGNLSYTFKIESALFYPFIRAGYGITNSVQFPVNGSLTRLSNSMDIGVLNLGAGLKTLLTESVLLRSEINYRRFTYSEEVFNYTYKLNLSSISLVFGISVLL